MSVDKRMPVVYVAGPFRAPTAWKRERNIREAEMLAFHVAECGAMPLCPHTNTRNFDGELTDEFWLNGTLELLRRCDAAIFTVRWEESAGARAEHSFCEENGIRTFHNYCSQVFTRWIAEWRASAGSMRSTPSKTTAGRG